MPLTSGWWFAKTFFDPCLTPSRNIRNCVIPSPSSIFLPLSEDNMSISPRCMKMMLFVRKPESKSRISAPPGMLITDRSFEIPRRLRLFGMQAANAFYPPCRSARLMRATTHWLGFLLETSKPAEFKLGLRAISFFGQGYPQIVVGTRIPRVETDSLFKLGNRLCCISFPLERQA